MMAYFLEPRCIEFPDINSTMIIVKTEVRGTTVPLERARLVREV